jgi:predicted ABC-type ATPase
MSMSNIGRFSTVFELPRQDIRLDPARFQGRQGEYSEDTVNAIVSSGRFDPTVSALVVWKDPDSGRYFLLSGHSRFEAAKRLYESGKQPGLTSLPVKELLNATEEEAVEYATIESNRRGTEEGLISDLKAYRLAVNSGKNATQLKRLFRPDTKLRKLQELSYLNPNGMFIEQLAAPSQQSFPYLERNARWVGDMRRQLPALTNAHERELFDYLYGSKKALNLDKAKFYDLVNNKVNRLDFDPELALNLHDRISPTAYTDPLNEQMRELDKEIDTAQKEIDTRRATMARASAEKTPLPKVRGLSADRDMTFEERIAELNRHIIRLIERKEALRQSAGKLERTMGGDLFSQVEEKVNAKWKAGDFLKNTIQIRPEIKGEVESVFKHPNQGVFYYVLKGHSEPQPESALALVLSKEDVDYYRKTKQEPRAYRSQTDLEGAGWDFMEKKYSKEPPANDLRRLAGKYKVPNSRVGGFQLGDDLWKIAVFTPNFNYQMLGRLQMDCDYFLGAGQGHEPHLHQGSVDTQIAEMKRIWNLLPEDGKPEWLSMEDILDYERKMKKVSAAKDNYTAISAIAKRDISALTAPKVMLVTRQYGEPIYIAANPDDKEFGFTGTDDIEEAVTWDNTDANRENLAELLKRAKFITGWDGLKLEAAPEARAKDKKKNIDMKKSNTIVGYGIAFFNFPGGIQASNTNKTIRGDYEKLAFIRHKATDLKDIDWEKKGLPKEVKDHIITYFTDNVDAFKPDPPKKPKYTAKEIADAMKDAWNYPEALNWAEKYGLVFRISASQVQWTEKGSDYYDFPEAQERKAKAQGRSQSNKQTPATAEKPSEKQSDSVSQLNKADTPRRYQLGDLWSADFDDDGMLRKAYNVKSLTRDEWQLLYNSLVDNNHHRMANALREAIEAFDNRSEVNVNKHLAEVREQAGKEFDHLGETGSLAVQPKQVEKMSELQIKKALKESTVSFKCYFEPFDGAYVAKKKERDTDADWYFLMQNGTAIALEDYHGVDGDGTYGNRWPAYELYQAMIDPKTWDNNGKTGWVSNMTRQDVLDAMTIQMDADSMELFIDCMRRMSDKSGIDRTKVKIPEFDTSLQQSTCPPMKDGKADISPEGLKNLKKCITSEPSTKSLHTDKQGNYSTDRKALHQRLIDEFKHQRPCVVKGKPIAVLTGGAPGSGKTHFLKGFAPWMNSDQVYHIDADAVRAKLPEYKGWNADNSHEETSDIVKQMLDSIGQPCKHDLVYDGTMNKAKKYLPLVRKLKAMGYEVLVIYMQVPREVSVSRAMERYQRTGRYVPIEVIDEVFDNGLDAYEQVIKEADGHIRVDGLTGEILEKGGKPIPTERDYDEIGCGTDPCNGKNTPHRHRYGVGDQCGDATVIELRESFDPNEVPQYTVRRGNNIALQIASETTLDRLMADCQTEDPKHSVDKDGRVTQNWFASKDPDIANDPMVYVDVQYSRHANAHQTMFYGEGKGKPIAVRLSDVLHGKIDYSKAAPKGFPYAGKGSEVGIYLLTTLKGHDAGNVDWEKEAVFYGVGRLGYNPDLGWVKSPSSDIPDYDEYIKRIKSNQALLIEHRTPSVAKWAKEYREWGNPPVTKANVLEFFQNHHEDHIYDENIAALMEELKKTDTSKMLMLAQARARRVRILALMNS